MHLRKRVDAPSLPNPPTVVNPTGQFDGNDGKWSTFSVNVNSDRNGVNGQNFKVLISTSSPITLLPMRNDWCDLECAERRGVMPYNGEPVLGMGTTNTWKQSGIYEIPLPYWYSDTLVNKTANQSLSGLWGITNVGLGESSAQSPVLPGCAVAMYTFADFFLGSFGLAAGEVGPTSSGSTRTFVSQYEMSQEAASSSYGYGAGAYYRNNGKGVPGSLVLGGYDNSRMTDQGYSISMSNTKNTTLVVGVPSITYAAAPGIDPIPVSLTYPSGGALSPFLANIDSTIPYLILPDVICDQFQQKFRLGYDQALNLYTVNSSSHSYNLQQNATVTFKIGDSAEDSDKFASIILPYAAFDQKYSDATGENSVDYFPIKKSKDGIYTLGRTFLQEAYIIVDYERANFTIAPAKYTIPMPKEELKIIYNTTYSPGARTSDSDGGLAPGAIAGTVVGIVIAFAIAGIIAFCWWKKRKNKKEADREPYVTGQIDPTMAGQEIKHRRVSELTGSDLPSSPKTPLGGYYSVDHKSVPPISEMSPDSPPVELYSPPPESASDVDGGHDYFTAGKPHRRGAQRDRASSGNNTPGTPVAELPGDEGRFHTPVTQFDAVSPLNSPLQSRGPSDTSLSTNIDERLADNKRDARVHAAEPTTTDVAVGSLEKAQPFNNAEPEKERRPSHQRGLSDITIASDSTAVSQPTPEEQERWAREPRRPLSE